MNNIDELIQELQFEINRACGHPDEKSWGYQEGILITENQAKAIIEILKQYKQLKHESPIG